MPVSRSKRKRPDVDVSGSTAAPSRRRARDSSFTGHGKKNEEGKSSDTRPASSASLASTQATDSRKTNPSRSKHSQSGGDHAEPSGPPPTRSSAPASASQTLNERDPGAPHLASEAEAARQREWRMRSLLEHRKLLLKRVTQGRLAATKRMDIMLIENQSTFGSTDEAEIAAFKDLAKEAASLSRKSRADPDAHEKRTSVRRGSSLGKRAASVQQSSTTGTDLSTGSGDRTVNQDETLSKSPVVKAVSPASTGPVAPLAASTSGRSSAAAQQSAPPKPPPPTKREQSQGRGNPASGRSAGTKASKTQTVSRGSMQGFAPGSSTSGAKGGPYTVNRMTIPSVVLPEAAVLRERRDAIQDKLQALLEKKQLRVTHHSERLSGAAKAATSSVAGLRSVRQRSLEFRQKICNGPGRPSVLPPRRKTHWDVVLDEMRWMATDFIEERKWKSSVVRMLGHAFTSHREEVDTDESKRQSLEPDSGSESVASGSRNSKDVTENGVDIGRDQLFLYKERSTDDENSARAASSKMSRMISGLTLTDFSNKHSKSNSSERGGSLKSVGLEGSGRLPLQKNENAQEEENENSVMCTGKEEALQRVGVCIDKVTSSLRNAESASSSRSSAKTHGLTLTQGQIRAIDGVEGRWDIGAGAIVCGPTSSGKTITTCSVIWRKRSKGPHLVVAGSASMIRWVHELGRFPELRSHILDEETHLHSPSSRFGAHDVVLCEYGTVSSLKEGSLAGFCVIVVDCRYPAGFRGSRLPSYSDSFLAPAELASCAWWDRLVGTVSSTPNRLLLDRSSRLEVLEGLPRRQKLEALALQVAFLLRIPATDIPHYSTAKLVILWCRRSVRTSEQGRSKFLRVQTMLSNLLEHLHCPTGVSKFLDDASFQDSSWELRRCEMTSSQRRSYDRACMDVRIALSRSLVSGTDGIEAASAALLRLRRLCLHSDFTAVFSASARESRLGHDGVARRTHWMCKGCADSASQPCVEVASRILQGSGKFQQLLSVLERECSIAVQGGPWLDEFTLSDTNNHRTRNNGRHSTSIRVVILAVLPEAQVLVSLFLNALGVDHELILGSFSTVHSDFVEPEKGSLLKAFAWTRGQLALSRFNSGNAMGKQIIVASPVTVAGDHTGLGAEESDVFVCIDDDWSGRQELVMMSLVQRCTSRREFSRMARSRFIRLVSAGTCEETFLSQSFGRELCESANIGEWQWPVTAHGSFALHEQTCRAVNAGSGKGRSAREYRKDSFQFPARNINALRGMNLCDVLATEEPVPLLFSTAAKLRFLPNDHGDDNTEVELVSRLLVEEKLTSPMTWHLERPPTNVLPPLEFPKNWMLREDFTHLSTRLYVTQFDTIFASDSDEAPSFHPSNPILPKEETVPVDDDSLAFDSFGMGDGRSVENYASSILFYDVSGDCGRSSSAVESAIDDISVWDGNQGCEAHVYYPPLFPRTPPFGTIAEGDAVFPQSDYHLIPKRARNTKMALPDAKRQRVESLEPMDVDVGVQHLLKWESGEGADEERGGLVSHDPSAASSALATVLPQSSSSSRNENLSVHFPIDAEEVQVLSRTASQVDAIILLVSSKRQRGFGNGAMSSHLQRPSLNVNGGRYPVVSGIHTDCSNGYLHETNGAGPGRKKKKGSNQKETSAVIARQPNTRDQYTGRGQDGVNPKDSHLMRLLTSLRHPVFATTLFESPSFRMAAVRVRDRIIDRIQSGLHWSPSGYRRELVVASPTRTTESRRLSNIKLRCFVDFGPFQSGFVALSSGMAFVSASKLRTGASLPTGVKVCQPSKDVAWKDSEDRDLLELSARYERNWTMTARALSGFQDIVTFSRSESPGRTLPRAARSCRDRWHSLSDSDQDAAASGFQLGDRVSEPNFNSMEMVKPQPGDVSIAGPSLRRKKLSVFYKPLPGDSFSGDIEQGKEAIETQESPAQSRRTFSAFNQARRKTQKAPISIPGVVSGSQPSIVANHSSHAQAVQLSVAPPAWTSAGRTEMWPLQMLDANDRQRTGVDAVSSSVTASGSRPTPSVVSSLTRGGTTATTASAVVVGNGGAVVRPATTSTAPVPSAGNGQVHRKVPPANILQDPKTTAIGSKFRQVQPQVAIATPAPSNVPSSQTPGATGVPNTQGTKTPAGPPVSVQSYVPAITSKVPIPPSTVSQTAAPTATTAGDRGKSQAPQK